ncbi:MAG TPA: carboxypeptidase-like regulatory domain-containing protein [Methanomassiliicoccales archaeon]|jgi:hypothetical protein
MRMRTQFKRDRSGGIEGLPLQLMIMVLIAGIGSAVLLGWMGNLNAPQSIGSVTATPMELVAHDGNGDGIFEARNVDVTITVSDAKGDPVTGATVVLDGCNIAKQDGTRPYGTTDSNGRITLNNLQLTQTGKAVGFVSVTVTKSGYGTDSGLSIPVISG